jgi:tape measure domain-containing protein
MARKVEIGIEVNNKGAISKYKKTADEISKSNKKIAKSSIAVAQTSQKATKSIVSGISAQKAAFVGLAGFVTGKFTQSFISAQKNVDRINNALKVGTGSVEGAKKEFAFLEKQSNRLGLELQSTALSYAQLTAAAKNSNLTMMEQREIFIGVSEAGAALGLSAADMEGALRAVQQMISKGNVQAEELRGQLGERIPGAFSLAAKAMNVTEKELNKLLETGKVTAAQLLPNLAKELRSTFGATAAKGPETLNGKINALQNSIFKLQRQLLDGGLGDILKQSFEGASTAVEFLGNNIEELTTIGKAFFAVWSAKKLSSLVTGLGGFNKGIVSINPVMAALAASVLAIDVALGQMDKRVKALGGLELTDAENNKRLKESLETIIELQDEFGVLQKKVKTSRGVKLGLLSEDELKKFNDFTNAVTASKEIIGSSFDPARANLEKMVLGLTVAEKGFEKVAAAAAKSAKKQKIEAPEIETKKQIDDRKKLIRDLQIATLSAQGQELAQLADFQKEKEKILGDNAEAQANLRAVVSKKALAIDKKFLDQEIDLLKKAEEEKTEIQKKEQENRNLLATLKAQNLPEGTEKEIALIEANFAKELQANKDNKDILVELERSKANEIAEIRKQARQQETAENLALAQVSLAAASNLANSLGELSNVRTQNDLKDARRRSEAEFKAAEDAGASEAKLKSIRENAIAQQESIRRKGFEKQKKFSLASAVLNTAQAATSGYATQPFVPLGLIAGTSALAAGAVQIAAINAQKFAQGGVVEGPRSGDSVPILANGGERVLTARQNREFERVLAGGGGGNTITFQAPVINVQNGDPVKIASMVQETMQEQIQSFSELQRDSEVHELI